MPFKCSATDDGQYLVGVGGGTYGGKHFGTWVLDGKGRVKARFKGSTVKIEPGDRVFNVLEAVTPSDMAYKVSAQVVRRIVKLEGSWQIVGPEITSWIPASAIPDQVKVGMFKSGRTARKYFVKDEDPAKPTEDELDRGYCVRTREE